MSNLDKSVLQINSMATGVAQLQGELDALEREINRLEINISSLTPVYDDEGNDLNEATRNYAQSRLRELESLRNDLNSRINVLQYNATQMSSAYQEQSRNAQKKSEDILQAKTAVFDKIASMKFGKSVASYSDAAAQRAKSYSDEARVYSSLANAASVASKGITTGNIDTTIANRGNFRFSNTKLGAGDMAEVNVSDAVSAQQIEQNVNKKKMRTNPVGGDWISTAVLISLGDNTKKLNDISAVPLIEKDKNLDEGDLDEQYGKMYDIDLNQMKELRKDGNLIYCSDGKSIGLTSGNVVNGDSKKGESDENKYVNDISVFRSLSERNVQKQKLSSQNKIEWNGKPGDSYCKVKDDAKFRIYNKADKSYIVLTGKELSKSMIERFGTDVVQYNGGEPDFEPFQHMFTVEKMNEFLQRKYGDEKMCVASDVSGSVYVEGMDTNRDKTFATATDEIAKKLGVSKEDVEDYMRENNLTWHECGDLHTIRAIPSDINQVFGHTGGIGIKKDIVAIAVGIKRKYGSKFILVRKQHSYEGTDKMDLILDINRKENRKIKKAIFGKK